MTLMTAPADPMPPEAPPEASVAAAQRRSDATPTSPAAPAALKASREALQALHRALAAALQDYLIQTPPEKRRASMLGVIRSFLSDNSVHVELKPATRLTAGPQALASDLGTVLTLPFRDDDPDDEPF